MLIYSILSVVLASLGWGLLHYIKKSAKLEVDCEILRQERDILHDQIRIASRPPASPSELLDELRHGKL